MSWVPGSSPYIINHNLLNKALSNWPLRWVNKMILTLMLLKWHDPVRLKTCDNSPPKIKDSSFAFVQYYYSQGYRQRPANGRQKLMLQGPLEQVVTICWWYKMIQVVTICWWHKIIQDDTRGYKMLQYVTRCYKMLQGSLEQVKSGHSFASWGSTG